MSETLTAPVVDPSEFTPEELDEIREQERIIDTQLETFIASGADTDEAFKNITESIERQAVANPKTFLAAREKLSELGDEDDPTDAQLDKEDILKDAIDGPLHARTVTKYGVFAPPTPEVRARVERAIEAVRKAESAEDKVARGISKLNTDTANQLRYGQAQADLEHAENDYKEGRATDKDVESRRFTVRHIRRGMDIQSKSTGYTQRELDAANARIAEIEATDVPDDDNRMKAKKAEALRDALRQRAEAQEDLEIVRGRVGETPATAREKLRNLLKEHPEGIDVVHQLEATHDNHATNAATQKDLLKARTKHEEAEAKVAELRRTLDAGDARLAIAQGEAFTARSDYEKAARYVTVDTRNADLLTEIADENALDKIALEEHEKTYGSLRNLEETVTESLLEWKKSKRPIDEHGSYVAIKKIEDYLAGLDEKIALARGDDRFLPHYRQLRNDAFDSYMQVQYSKEFVRTEMFANVGGLEGRYPFAHDVDKGIVVERGDGSFAIYPDGSYRSLYPVMAEDGITPLIDRAGKPVMRGTPRVDADGELVTSPILEQIPDPHALIEPTTLRAWDAMTTENLQTVNDALYKEWIASPANSLARAHLEVVSGMLRERTTGDGTTQAMEATYIERYLGVGREGNLDRLDPQGTGSVLAHMTLHGIEGDWVIHPNGTADMYTPGTTEPIGRYAANGTLLGAYGPEEEPIAPSAPEGGDDGDDGDEPSPDDGSGGAPSTPTPSAPIAPTPPAAPTPVRPSAIGSVRPPRVLRPEASTPADSGEDEPEPGTVSAGAAPTPPPTPPNPDAGEATSAAKKSERRAPQPITTEDRKAIKEVLDRTLPESVIYTTYDTLEHGPVTQIQGGTAVSEQAAQKRIETDSAWSQEDIDKYKVEPESVVLIPIDQNRLRLQYRYEPRPGMDQSTRLLIDIPLSSEQVPGLLDKILEKPEIAREMARNFYEAQFGPGSWTLLGRPPYEQLKNAELTVAMANPADKRQFFTRKYRIGE